MTTADIDPIQTKEWCDEFRLIVQEAGPERAAFLLQALDGMAADLGIVQGPVCHAPYQNTPLNPDLVMPAPAEMALFDEALNKVRWNAMAMVMRAGRLGLDLGGHLASFASIATLFEIGFQYFFRAKHADHGGDLVFFQGHSSPGIYARAYLEGRLTEADLDRFRQEALAPGLSSYPHPWLMPDFWQFPTVSMGLGPLMAIYQAHFLKYLHLRGKIEAAERKVWAFCGDGEMGEPESLGLINLAAREQLDNLIFVINCNLQRLDGPVWGNGQVIQEFDSIFRGAGWRVIKIIFGESWQPLLEKDTKGLIVKRFSTLVDGEYQRMGARDPVFMREVFFGASEELKALVADWSDEDLIALTDGGHDPRTVYAAYAEAMTPVGRPTVILAKTVKGYGMGISGEAKNISHQAKKMTAADLAVFRDRFALPLTDEDLAALNYHKPSDEAPVMAYIQARRAALGGYLPARSTDCESLAVPALSAFSAQLQGSGTREISTTMAFVRILSTLLKHKPISDRVIPILADESRTFGMEGLFRQIGIYSPHGQLYEPEDRDSLMYYREDQTGQLLQEGLSEPGAMSAWIAAATSYSNNAYPTIPFYIYYSMFGFQRCGDLAWAAGDLCARGFIIGATAGRTTLAGEGLQHQDGHNLLMFSMVPNCVTYDPTFAYEMAVIIQSGLERMYVQQENVYYYITAMNENYTHPEMPAGAEEGIVRGMYLYRTDPELPVRIQLMGSGTILREVIAAADQLAAEYGIGADIWSVTSFNLLRQDSESVARYNRLHPTEPQRTSYVRSLLADRPGPVVAATDYMKLYANQIASEIDAPYYVLGTDGFGRSDSRAALRDFFEVDQKMIVYTALRALADAGDFDAARLPQVIADLGIDPNRPDPVVS